MTSHSGGSTTSGDLVLIDYELWAEGGGRTDLVDTTKEEVAQAANVPLSEGQKFGPHPHLIGGEYFPRGIEEALVGVPIGGEVAKEFPPAEAFGDRDPKLIELFGMHEIQRLPEMRREDAHLDLGTVLTIKGRRGRVVSLTAARVRVDFNPTFAGRKIRGTFKVLSRVEDPSEKVKALVELTYGRSGEFHVEVRGGHITLKVPDRAKFDAGWLISKGRVIETLRSQLKPEKITLAEEYVTPAKDEKAPAKEEKAKPAAPGADAPAPEPSSSAKAKAD